MFPTALAIIVIGVTTAQGRGAEAPQNFSSADLEKLGVKPAAVKRDPRTGFSVGGKNPTALVRKLTEIAGRSIDDLEDDMRPGALSRSGFLGKGERLLDVLAADNQRVVDELGLTHQTLALHLRAVAAIGARLSAEAKGADRGSPRPFLYHGRKFKVKLVHYRGFQDSPFQDGTRTNTNATVWNLDNGKQLTYSLLVPDMIERYGFYEGKGTSYRVEPRAVLEVLDFLKPAKKR
jgi:hypothetical protein